MDVILLNRSIVLKLQNGGICKNVISCFKLLLNEPYFCIHQQFLSLDNLKKKTFKNVHFDVSNNKTVLGTNLFIPLLFGVKLRNINNVKLPSANIFSRVDEDNQSFVPPVCFKENQSHEKKLNATNTNFFRS